MNLEQILETIAHGEGSTVEFKQEFGDSKQALRTVSAFANTEGGLIIFGVDDEGEIIGIDVTEKNLRTISDTIHNSIKPHPHVEYKIYSVGKKKIFVLHVHPSPKTLHYYSTAPYKRVATQDYQMEYEEIQNFLSGTTKNASSSSSKLISKNALFYGVLLIFLLSTVTFFVVSKIKNGSNVKQPNNLSLLDAESSKVVDVIDTLHKESPDPNIIFNDCLVEDAILKSENKINECIKLLSDAEQKASESALRLQNIKATNKTENIVHYARRYFEELRLTYKLYWASLELFEAGQDYQSINTLRESNIHLSEVGKYLKLMSDELSKLINLPN